MKLVKKQVNVKDGEGSMILRAEDPEDMWHVYNLIHVGDSVQTTTIRKVVKEGATGSTTATRLRLTLKIDVEATHFDPSMCVLRIRGRNIQESQHVKMGAYHTLDLEVNRNFTLYKQHWDAMTLERIEMSCNFEKTADVAAVVMQTGMAHICLIKGDMTVIRAKIEIAIPKKRPGYPAQAKAIKRFYEAVFQSLLRHVDFTLVKGCLLASPGFVKDDFFKYMMEESSRRDEKRILEYKDRFLLCHASSGHKHALDEVLKIPTVQNQLCDTKAVGDVKALDSFFEMMHVNADKAYYGYGHVLKADTELAIECLLVTDALFRSPDLNTRRQYIALVESVREHGGTVRIFSSLHVSGEKLAQISGIAALLRFPLPDLDEYDTDEDENLVNRLEHEFDPEDDETS